MINRQWDPDDVNKLMHMHNRRLTQYLYIVCKTTNHAQLLIVKLLSSTISDIIELNLIYKPLASELVKILMIFSFTIFWQPRKFQIEFK